MFLLTSGFLLYASTVKWAFPVTAMLCSDEVMGVAFLDSASWSTSIMVNMLKTKIGAQG